MKKYFKKLITLLLIFVTLVSFTACTGGSSAEARLRAGIITDDVYINEWLGLQFQFPSGWFTLSSAELQLLLGFAGRFTPGEEINISEAEWNELGEVVDLFAMQVAGSNVLIGFERVRAGQSGSAFINLLATNARRDGAWNIYTHANTVQLGERQYYVLDFNAFVLGDVVVSQRMLVNIENRIATVIVITARTDEERNHLMQYFNVPGAALIDSRAFGYVFYDDFTPPTFEELLGEWAWDGGNDFIYQFNKDGTGIRGFPAMREKFTWELVDYRLYLTLGFRTEQWRIAIVDDVITISSLQVPGMFYSYIRQ